MTTSSDEFQEMLDQIKNSQSRAGGNDSPASYDKFLEALRDGKHPPFCDLIWNGEAYHIRLLLHFQRPPEVVKPPDPSAQVFRQEAYRRFKRIGPAEQRLLSIQVTIKNWLPVTAEVIIRPEAAGVLRLGTAQLLDIQNP